MKKLLGIVVLGLLWCNILFAQELIKVPVYVHIMEVQKEGFKTLTKESDVKEDFKKANKIWSQANIFFEIKNINFTKPDLRGFNKINKLRDLDFSKATTKDTRSKLEDKKSKEYSEFLIKLVGSKMFKLTSAKSKVGTLNPNGINVFYLPNMFGITGGHSINPTKQVIKIKRYIGFVMIDHTDAKREIVLAHELGHQFSLRHEGENKKDLMMYGGGTYISPRIKKAVHDYYNTIYKPIKYREWTYKK